MLSSRYLVSLLTLVILAACGDATRVPTQPPAPPSDPATLTFAVNGGANRIVEESIYDLSDSYTSISCVDGQESELVALEGQVYEKFTLLFTPNGIHLLYNTMPVGLRGIGTVSGEEYRVKEQDHGSFGQPNASAGAVGTYREMYSLVSRTSGKSFKLVVKGHYTMKPNLEFIVNRERVTTVCDS